jgi:hypothetical protein
MRFQQEAARYATRPPGRFGEALRGLRIRVLTHIPQSCDAKPAAMDAR